MQSQTSPDGASCVEPHHQVGDAQSLKALLLDTFMAHLHGLVRPFLFVSITVDGCSLLGSHLLPQLRLKPAATQFCVQMLTF